MLPSGMGKRSRMRSPAREWSAQSTNTARVSPGSSSAPSVRTNSIPRAANAELSEFEAGPGQRLLDLRGGTGWELLTRTLLSLGELDAAAEAAATADARARTSLLPQRAATAMLAGARAAVLLARGDAAAAVDTAREALPLAQSADNPVLGARARALIGTALGRVGSTDEAVSEPKRRSARCSAPERCARRTRPRRSCGGSAGGRYMVRTGFCPAAPRGLSPARGSPR